jgi:hypothetical protein
MKISNILVLFLIIHISSSYAQAPEIQWQKAIGGTQGDQAISIRQTPDGGFIAAGDANSNDGDVIGNHSFNFADVWIVKYDFYGNIQWQKLFGGTSSDWANCIELTSDGGYIFTGCAISNDGDVTGNDGLRDLWVVKLDASGTLEWQKTFGGLQTEEGRCIRQVQDGGFIIAGMTSGNGGDVTGFHGKYDFWILKLNNTGELEWQKALGGSEDDQCKNIVQCPDGSYLATGWTSSTDGDVTGMKGCYDAWIVKLNSSGTLLWQKTVGNWSCDDGSDIACTSDGGFVLAGNTMSNIPGYHDNSDFWLAKFSVTGTLEWQKAYGGSEYDECYSLEQTVDGGYVLAGYTYSDNGDVIGKHGSGDGWIIKTDPAGNLQWQKPLGGSNPDQFFCVVQSTDGGFILAGMAQSNDGDLTENKGYYDLWVVKLFPDPFLGIPDQAAGMCIFPNPASDHFEIRFPNSEYPENITITDLNGRIVLEYLPENWQVNIKELTAGIYLIHAYSKNYTLRSKLIKI